MTRKTPWVVTARRMLRSGYGVEDIAVGLRIDVDHVRFLVRKLRETGQLHNVLFGDPSKA